MTTRIKDITYLCYVQPIVSNFPIFLPLSLFAAAGNDVWTSLLEKQKWNIFRLNLYVTVKNESLL